METLTDKVFIKGKETKVSFQYDTIQGKAILRNGCYLDGDNAGEWFDPANFANQFHRRIKEVERCSLQPA